MCYAQNGHSSGLSLVLLGDCFAITYRKTIDAQLAGKKLLLTQSACARRIA